MLHQEFLLFLRSLFSNKLYSAISLFTLVIAFLSTFFIWDHVDREQNFDTYHKDHDQMVRIVSSFTEGDHEYEKATSPGALGYYLKENIPTVENYFTLSGRYGPYELWVEDRVNYGDYFFATEGITDLLSFNFISGSALEFRRPKTAMISQSRAEALFGEKNPVGKSFSYDFGSVQVVGVYEDFPENSHFKPELIIKAIDDWEIHKGWDNTSYYTYVKMDAEGSEFALNELLEEVNETHFLPGLKRDNKAIQGTTLKIQKLSDIHLSGNRLMELRPNNSKSFVDNLFLISLLILVVALTNFASLYMVQFRRRFKEIGIRKITGESLRSLYLSFVFRPFAQIVISFGLALLAFFSFSSLLENTFLIGDPGLSAKLLPRIALLLIIVLGFFSVLFLFIIRRNMNPVELLRNTTVMKIEGRRISYVGIYIVLQFVVSGFLLGSTLFMHEQLSFISNADLGMNTDQVLRVDMASKLGDHAEVLIEALDDYPEFKSVARANYSPGSKNNFQNQAIRTETGKLIENRVMRVGVSEGFVPTLGLHVLQGRNLTRYSRDSLKLEAIVNESFVKAYGIQDPLGLVIRTNTYSSYIDDVLRARVVGVVEDFHFSNLHEEIQPMYFTNNGGRHVFLKIASSDLEGVFPIIEKHVEQVTGSSIYHYEFLDQFFERQYQAEQDKKDLIFWASGIAILIALLGMFATSAKLVLSKTRETSIRKVFGASVSSLLIKYSMSTVKYAIMGFMISVPLVYDYVNNWLEEFAYKIEMGIGNYLTAFAILFTLSLLSVLFNSNKAAQLNPVEGLRAEG